MLQLLTQPLSAETVNGAGVNWRTAEAALFCVGAISKSALLSPVHIKSPRVPRVCGMLSLDHQWD